jgi:hypothetical protein
MTTMTDWTKTKLNHSQVVLTKADLAKLPALYSQDGKGEDAIAQVHFFSCGGYDFWATEFDPATGELFGVARIHEREFGYVTVQEFVSMAKAMFPIERDLHWTPKPLKECGK